MILTFLFLFIGSHLVSDANANKTTRVHDAVTVGERSAAGEYHSLPAIQN